MSVVYVESMFYTVHVTQSSWCVSVMYQLFRVDLAVSVIYWTEVIYYLVGGVA